MSCLQNPAAGVFLLAGRAWLEIGNPGFSPDWLLCQSCSWQSTVGGEQRPDCGSSGLGAALLRWTGMKEPVSTLFLLLAVG